MYIDILYYKIYVVYKENFKSDIPGIYSVSFIVLLIFLHLLLFHKLMKLIIPNFVFIDFTKEVTIIIIMFLYLLLGLRYLFFFEPKKIEQKINRPIRYKTLIIYILTFLIVFFFVITI